MGTKLFIGLGIVSVILAASMYVLLAPASIDDAILYIETGVVEVNTGTGWQQATNEMLLAPNAKVRTQKGEAIIVLLEGEVVKLEANTQISITELNKNKISIEQTKGQTWHKITKLSGITQYSTATPTTVATVRGTEFYLNNKSAGVTQGSVAYKNKETKKEVQIPTGQKGVYPNMTLLDLTEIELASAQKFRNQYIATLKKIRTREIRKHKTLITLAKSKGYTEEQMLAELEKIDQGQTDLDKLREKVPGPFESKTKRAFELTRVIRDALAQT